MNKVFKVFFLLVALFALNGFASAQTVKIAHVNTNEVMNAMPDKAKAEKKLETYYNELRKDVLSKTDALYSKLSTAVKDAVK